LPDNGSVRTFPWQGIDAVTDELFKMVIYIQFASKLQKRVPAQSRDSPAPEFTRELHRESSRQTFQNR
jgi:hypothetical protein